MANTQGTIAASEWSGTEQKEIAFTAQDVDAGEIAGVIVRYVNGLDVAADIGVDLTDDLDEDFERAQSASFDGSSTKSVSAESGGTPGFDDDLLTEPYDRVRVTITPASQPSSGEFSVITTGN